MVYSRSKMYTDVQYLLWFHNQKWFTPRKMCVMLMQHCVIVDIGVVTDLLEDLVAETEIFAGLYHFRKMNGKYICELINE